MSAFPAPARDDNYAENLAKSRFLLACISPVSPDYDLQLFQLYRLSQACAKLYTIVLVKGCSSAEDFAVFRHKFSFAERLNVLKYRPGLFRRFER